MRHRKASGGVGRTLVAVPGAGSGRAGSGHGSRRDRSAPRGAWQAPAGKRGSAARRAVAVTGLALLAVTLTAVPATAERTSTGHDGPSLLARLTARQPLPAGDGWGSAGAGTTGGGAATSSQVHVVSSRAELVEALGGDNATNAANAVPKLIFIRGTINGFEGPDGAPLGCDDFADPAYDFDAYLATYDPAVWGRETDPSGPLEEARARSVSNQGAHTVINVGSNTTLYGLRGARLHNLTLMLNEADNVIVRNITFDDAFDCFPRWDPNDGAAGNWNSNWDNVSARRGTNFWFDHNTFTDGANPDSGQPVIFGRPYQVHDGALDITHTSDLATVSYNVFTNHDKMMLIGSTDNPTNPGDVGLLNVTLHHNLIDGIGQRAPRVRFGHVDVYNNYYRVPGDGPYSYSWGVGVQSATYVEGNFFSLDAGIDPADVIGEFNGTAITELDTWARIGGEGTSQPISMLDAFNAANDPPLGNDVGWTPELRRGPVLPARVVPAVVTLLAGAGRLPR
jgi:pectate lyase